MSHPQTRSGAGLLFGLGAYGLWGLFPAFFPPGARPSRLVHDGGTTYEAMSPARWAGFALIWVALTVFSADAVRRARTR